MTSGAVYLLMVTGLSIFLAVFGLSFFALRRALGNQALLLAPFVWVSLELARNYLGANGFPWCLLGYSQVEHLRLIQIADLTGVYGVSLLIAWVNSLLCYAFSASRKRDVLMASLSILLFVGSATLYGHLKWREHPTSENASKIKVAVIQGNVPITENNDILAKKFLVDYPRLIRSASATDELVILPESPTPFSFEDDRYRDFVMKMVRESRIWLLFNNTTYDATPGRDCFNSAYLLNPRGQLVSRYHKIHLVPFGEYVPFRKVLFFAGKVLKEVSDFKSGVRFVVSELEESKFSTLICYESIFPELSREFVRSGAQFLVILTNDGWYGDSAAPYQHFNMAILRAVENRRYLVRAANNGVSGIIDPYGRVLVRSNLFREEVVKGEITPSKERTVYTRFGDVFAWFCVMITCGALVYSMEKAR